MMRTQYGVNLRVINASWGSTGSDGALSRAIQAAGDAGILFVCAAGNSASNNDVNGQYPANYRLANVVSVAASDMYDQLASFSSYGAASVDLAAPGVSIYSTLPGNNYGWMRGTSMATPQVAGVAALAWSVAPNATVAQIRNALLQGVDRVGSLTGRVVTGGRLNALNTLRLLNPSNPRTPVIASLSATPGTVEAGRSFTLTAQGVALSGGTITGVSFYQDSNANGQWDAGDCLLGSSGAIVGGQASLGVSTAGMAVGTYRYFARATDGQDAWSATAAAQVTLVTADDHGNTAGTATVINVGSAVQGAIQSGGDVDWFKVQVVAGKSYSFQTTLGTHNDTVLTLYAADGQRVLAVNDDISSSNFASRIAWRAPASGICYLKVAGYGASDVGSYSLATSVINTAPVLARVANQTVIAGRALTVRLGTTDADSDRLTYSVRTVTPVSPGLFSLAMSGNRLIVRTAASLRGNVEVVVSVSDGTNIVSQRFTVMVAGPAASRQPAPTTPNPVPSLRRLASFLSSSLHARSVDLALAGNTAHSPVLRLASANMGFNSWTKS
jgi:hypothetical protein